MKLDAKGAKYARFALRGCLTRLALCFDMHATYTGGEVQNILLGAMLSLDGPIDAPEQVAQLAADIVEGAAPLELDAGKRSGGAGSAAASRRSLNEVRLSKEQERFS